MEKALEILNNIYFDDSGVMCVEKSTALDVFNAIKELEEAMKPKTCEGCYWWSPSSFMCIDHKNELAGTDGYFCGRHEPKDTQC